jgi:uncharacterized protein
VHRLILRHPRLILWIAGLLTAAALLACLRLRLELNLLSLLPPDNPQTRAFLEVTEKIGLQSVLIAVVHPAAGVADHAMEALVERLAEGLRESPLVKSVRYRRDEADLARYYPLLLRHLPRLLPPDELRALPALLTDEAVQQRVAANRKLLLSPLGFAAQSLMLADPLALGELLHKNGGLPSQSEIGADAPGFFRTADGSLLIFVEARQPPQDIPFSRRLMAETLRIESAALEHAARAIDPTLAAVTIEHTGGYPIAVNDEALTKRDIQITIATSLVGVLTIFGLCLRRLITLVQVGAALLMSIVWTLGLAGLLFGQLNLLTCIFSCVLAGLGIDFAIHIVNRFYHRSAATHPEERLALTFRHAGGGVIVGALTTAMAFFAVGLSDFRGFRELGILTGAGLLFCAAIMLFFLPVLLMRTARQKADRPMGMAGFGLRALLTLAGRRPILALVVIGIAAAALISLAPRVGFDDNLRNFRPPDDRALQLQEAVTAWMGGSSASALLVVEGASEIESLDRAGRIWQTLQPLQTQGEVAAISALQSFLPPPEQQRQGFAAMHTSPWPLDWVRIRRTFYQALAENSLEALPAYATYFATLEAAFDDTRILLPSRFADTELRPLLHLFQYEADGRHKSVIYIRPAGDLWSRQEADRFRQVIEGPLSDAGIQPDRYTLTSGHLLSAELKHVILSNLGTALVLAVIAIVAVLLLYYRSALLLVGALLPVSAALAMLAGLMALLKIDFNLLNVIVLPMVVGIGIDDGVHLTNTFRANGGRFDPADMAATARGCVLTSLTTMVGFGSIAFSHYPGLKSMGLVALLGVGLCLLAALLLLAPLLALIGRKTTA